MVIFINGSINAGKSTVAKILAGKIPKSALIEIDVFHEMIEWMPIDEAVPLNLENALSVIKNFVSNNIHCIVPYPLSRENYDFMNKGLKDCHVDIRVFTLAPDMETVMSGQGRRKPTDWEKDRIKHHYDIGIPTPDFGEVINNAGQTPEETVGIIMKKLDLTLN
ncbi:MAG: hypothetical protein V2A55_02330 [Candidatus Jorgensenbacteria bacterium]